MKCYHHNDMDGRCAAAIVAEETKNYNLEDYIEIDYVTPIPVDSIKNGETIYFVAYSFSGTNIKVLETLLKKGCQIVWIDHHKTSCELIETHPEYKDIPGIVCEGESGALLTYRFFHKNDIEQIGIPHAIELVSDYDCWQFQYGDETTYFKLGVDAEKNSPLSPLWHDIIYDNKVKDSRLEQTIKNGHLLKKYVDEENTWYREHYGYESELDGYECFVLNLKTNSWVFGDKYKTYPLCVAYVYNGECYVYTLYSSNPEIDCSKIAKHYGGGGHVGAAGFSSIDLLVKRK